MVASGHSCPVGQLSTSGTQFSWVTGLFCHGSVKLPNNAPSLSEQCQLHTGTRKGQHGKLHLPIPDFCASCQQPQIALRGRGGAGQAGRQALCHSGTAGPSSTCQLWKASHQKEKSKRRCGPSAVCAYVHCLHCSAQSLLHLIVLKITWFVQALEEVVILKMRTSCTDHESLERTY